MTNEKGMEESKKVLFYSSDLGRNLEVESINLKTNTFVVRPDGIAMVLDGANKLFDLIRAEAVKAERERCVNIILGDIQELRNKKTRDRLYAAVQLASAQKAILSDDQEPEIIEMPG